MREGIAGRVVWVCVLVCAGCTTPSTGAPSDVLDAGATDATEPTRELTADLFFQRYAEARCHLAIACNPTAEGWCHPYAKETRLGSILEMVRGGALRFEARAGARCLAELDDDSRSCPGGWDLSSPSCRLALAGNGEVGEECWRANDSSQPLDEQWSDCAGGLHCRFMGRDVPGQCRRHAGLDEPCLDQWDCVSWEEGTLECSAAGLCRPAPSEGACTGTLCAASPCDFESRVCLPPPVEGQPCTSYGDCWPELGCVEGRCALQLPRGAACDDTQSDICDEGQCFDADGPGPEVARCRGDLGEADDFCFMNYFPGEQGDSCRGPWVCSAVVDIDDDSWMGTCVPGAPVGAPCGDLAPCARGATCLAGRCHPKVGPSAPCSRGEVCPIGFVCADGRCQARARAGERCGAEMACIEGRCEDGLCCLGRNFAPCAQDPATFCARACLEDGCSEPPRCPEACPDTCTDDGRCAPRCR